jgi:hypothetical protein
MSDITDILASIDKLQQTETAVIEKLSQLTSIPQYEVTPEIIDLREQISNLSDARLAMYNAISDKADVLQTGVANSRTDLVSQMTLLGVVEDQLNKAKDSIDKLQNRNDTKMRMVQINTYYGKRYESQGNIMKKIIFVCVPLLILFILKKKGKIPELISNYAIGITIAVGAFVIIGELWDFYTRSNIDFDEYDWKYENPAAHSPSIWEYNKKHMFNFDNPIKSLVGNLGLCMGADCCANGLYFNEDKQKCTTIESFVCGNKLNGTAVANFDKKDEETQNGITPFTYNSSYANI